MIEIKVEDKDLEGVLFTTLEKVVKDFNRHFKIETTISRLDLDVCKVNKLLWGKESKEELWGKIIDLIKSSKIKTLLSESGASLRRLDFKTLEIEISNNKHYSKLVTSWDAKEALLKALEKVIGIVPMLGVRFYVSGDNS